MRGNVTAGAFGALLALSILAACGGGGGSSAPLPGGGNPGGGVPSQPPNGTPAPGTTPTPVSSSTPGTTPTPLPTPTHQPTPTPPPTPTPFPTPTPSPNQTLTVTVGHGEVNPPDGDGVFTGGIGEETGDGDYATGGQGPVNSTFGPAQIPCLAAMYDGPIPPGYHVHPFLGIYYNGKEVALPDGVGMADPEADGMFQGIPDWTQYAYNPQNPKEPGCFYQMHTHDASGLIHVESSNPNNIPQNGSMYTLGDFLGLWGIPLSNNQFGPLTGSISVWTSGQISRGGPGSSGEVLSNTYTLYNGNYSQIPLYSHEVIWVLVGSGNPTGASLPNVSYWDEW